MRTRQSRESLAFWSSEIKESLADWCREGGFWRWTARVLGVACVLVWVWMIWWEEEARDSALSAIGQGLFAFGFLVAGAVLLVPTLVRWVAWPFFRFIDSVYLGSHDIERPPLTYDVAERLLRERRWQDAATEFERIAYWHPTEERAWREAIRCAELAGDAAGAEWLRRRARVRCPGGGRI